MTTVLSLFSGVGGFDVGLERAGMRTVYQCEIDQRCRSVLARHWSDVPRWGDITTLTGREILRHAPQIDVVAWGSPCQDLSIAGTGAGLNGTRSSLFHEGIRIINEIRKATDGKYPRVSIWENVAGALSSNKGRDFGRVLATLAESGACFSEWHTLDAQYFGIPHRRRRVFIISVFDPAVADRCAEPLLPVSEGVQRRAKTSGTQGQDTAEASARRTEQGCLFDEPSDRRIVTPILSFDTQFGSNANVFADVSPTVKASQSSPSVLLPSLAVRQREGKAGGGKGLLISEEMSLTLLNANEQMIVQRDDEHDVLRRLVPIETERLMGWSDDWTRYAADGSEIADTQRFKMCGNGVASPVAQWIGEHLMPMLNES